MGIKNKISNYQGNVMDSFNENAYMNDSRYIQDKLVEKWSRVPELGKGIKDLEARKARNLATMLENQTRYMSKLKESDMTSTFNG